jgi:hypothetical protein
MMTFGRQIFWDEEGKFFTLKQHERISNESNRIERKYGLNLNKRLFLNNHPEKQQISEITLITL